VMGRGADYIIIDDPIKADEALSESRRTAVNESFNTSIATRLNRDTGAMILIMQRLPPERPYRVCSEERKMGRCGAPSHSRTG
jgi:hypothetical protein